MNATEFSCSCGRRLTAIILPPRTPHDCARIEFFNIARPGVPRKKITECPNCQKSFAEVSVEAFLEESSRNW
jgi:hypothetical protein